MRDDAHTTPRLRMETDLLGFRRFVPADQPAAARSVPTEAESAAVLQAAADFAAQVGARRSPQRPALAPRSLDDHALLAHYRAIIGEEQSACDAWAAYDAELAAWRAAGSRGRAPVAPVLDRPSLRASAAATRAAAIEAKLELAE